MNTVLQALLNERKPSKRGIHGTAQWSTPADYYEQQFGAWAACGFSWLKLVCGGDSQVDTCRRIRDHHLNIIPIIRFYKTDCPINSVAPDLCKPYVDVGAVVFESPFNEFYSSYENIWGNAGMPADWPQQVAHGWALFADSVLRAGGVPTTPAIEGWRYNDIFEPLFAVLCANYADLLRQSIIAMHNRPLNHPVDYAKDTGGYLAWKSMDAYVFNRLGEHIPMAATEAMAEPGWDQDRTYPQVTPEMHMQNVKDTLSYPTPPYYLCDCGWLWHDDGTFGDASWSRNRTYADGADLPVVQMLATWRPEAATPDLSDATILAIGLAHPSAISVNHDAAFYKAALDHGFGHPESSEWDEKGWRWQKYERGIVAAKIGEWDKVRTVKR